MIYVRSVKAGNGRLLDLYRYCSEPCWLESLEDDPPNTVIEEGGPLSADAEGLPAFSCSTCGEVVGSIAA